MEALLKVLAVPALMAIGWLLVTGLRRLNSYLKAKEQATVDGSAADLALKAASLLSECAADGVSVVESELRPLVKAVTEDGKITPEEADKLRAEAFRIAKERAMACAPGLLKVVSVDALLASYVDSWAARIAGDSRAKSDPQ